MATRAAKATDVGEAARALRAEGLIYREIAARLGISLSYAAELCTDPDGTKTRARKTQGQCEDCGTRIRSDSPGRHPQRRCVGCQREHRHANRKWTPETIVEAIQRWASLYGMAPTSSAWSGGSQQSVEDRERFAAGDYPHVAEVMGEFDGSFGKALRVAGFEPRHPWAGEKRNRVSEAEYSEMERMRADGKTVAEIAKELGIKKSAAAMRLSRKKGAMTTSLKAETVIEREIARFEDRKKRAEATAQDAAEQVERLKLALKALTNGKPEPKG